MIPQIKYLVQGDADHERETLDEFTVRVNTEAMTLKAFRIETSHVSEIENIDVLHDDGAGNVDTITDLDYEYDGFNMAVLHYHLEPES